MASFLADTAENAYFTFSRWRLKYFYKRQREYILVTKISRFLFTTVSRERGKAMGEPETVEVNFLIRKSVSFVLYLFNVLIDL